VIHAVGLVVPAPNEEAAIATCPRSVRGALGRLPAEVRVEVAVVLDRCEDRTPSLAAGQLRGWPGARVLRVAHRPLGAGVGFVRDLGVRDLLRRLHPARPEQIWLLSTDADTAVPPGWAVEQLRYAAAGVHGVAGLADLADERGLSAHARSRYRAILADGMRGRSHDHVYAANLGVRADAYLRCGGFPAWGHGEERQLWQAMSEAGCRLRQPTDLRVRTSARTRGRAAGGVADLLRSLQTDAQSRVGSENVA
jgi:hypothetical protein